MSSAQQSAREAFGNRLRDVRLDAGISGRRLAALTGFHYTKVSRVEHGGQSLSDADIRVWAQACGADQLVPDLVAQMRAVDTLYREWRRVARIGLRRLQEPAAQRYERTSRFRIHEHWVVPGLIQTEAYSMAIMAHSVALLEVPDDRAAANEIRMKRQRVLRQGDHRFVFLLAEQVLYSIVPTAAEMVEQLDCIVEVMDLPRVSLGIIPATAGLSGHAQTAFWIFDNSLVQIETPTAGLDITRPDEIAVYESIFETMRRVAVFGRNAKGLIAKARHELLQQSAPS